MSFIITKNDLKQRKTTHTHTPPKYTNIDSLRLSSRKQGDSFPLFELWILSQFGRREAFYVYLFSYECAWHHSVRIIENNFSFDKAISRCSRYSFSIQQSIDPEIVIRKYLYHQNKRKKNQTKRSIISNYMFAS